MKRTRWILTQATLLSALVFLAAPPTHAQFKEDALRLATPGFGVGARSLGMGNAYSGVASDFSALYWNPAGLAQAQYGEFSFGLSHLRTGDKSTFFGNLNNYDNSATNLNTLGFVLPVPVRRGALAFAFGYTRQATFTSGVAFSGYNTLSSIIQTWAPDNTPYPQDETLAEKLYLAQIDTTTGRFISPIKNNVWQEGTATEAGGLNNWMAGGAIDVGPNFSAGITLTYVSGSYRYDRNYHERDTRLVHVAPFDFSELVVDDFIEDDISGVNAKFGMMYRVPDRFRFGLTIKTPTSFTIKETFGTTAQSTFRTPDNQGNNAYGPETSDGSSEYDVHTPWVFGGGLSVTLRNLTISGDAEYADWTTLEFANANQDVMDENKTIKKAFRETVNLRAGGEFDTQIGLRLRGGFIYNPSVYKGDPSSFAQKYVTAGAGVLLGEGTMLDFGYAHGWWNTYRVNYDATSRVDEKISTNTFLLTLTHRF